MAVSFSLDSDGFTLTTCHKAPPPSHPLKRTARIRQSHVTGGRKKTCRHSTAIISRLRKSTQTPFKRRDQKGKPDQASLKRKPGRQPMRLRRPQLPGVAWSRRRRRLLRTLALPSSWPGDGSVDPCTHNRIVNRGVRARLKCAEK